MTLTDMRHELANLQNAYGHELDSLADRIATARNRTKISSHDAFNMSANCQNLALLAGKIEQTANVIRWMETAEKDAELAASLKACTGATAVTVKTTQVK